MKNQFILFFFIISLFSSCSEKKKSEVNEYSKSIITYPYSDPNPFPIIPHKNDIYPYFRIDGFSFKGNPKEWKVVKLENQYIEVYILPEQGGKVWGAIDKITGKEFIYKNDVMKFRDIAMRGPWTSGGIEWNSGVIGHHPGTATPVNYKYFTDSNGTAHCVVGGMDLPSHLQWRVDISLAANQSFFQSKTFWFNDSPFFQSYYHWNNSAVKSAKDLQFYFPGNYWIGHDGLSHSWPVDKEGVDRSWYKNNADGISHSFHIFGSIDNYFASFYHDENFGSGHWSESYGTPGKKIFLWSQARNGAIWEDLLTDTHGQYVELQAGRMFNQNSIGSGETPFKQMSFLPYGSDSWTERWFPIRNTNGVNRISKSGTVNIKLSDGKMIFWFSPVLEVNDDLNIIINGKKVEQKKISLDASETFRKEIENISRNDVVEIYLGSEQLYSNNDKYLITRPVASSSNTLNNKFVNALELENRRSYGKALKKYLELIKTDSLHFNALEHIAELYVRRGEYKKAEVYVRKALEINSYLPKANFTYGYLKKLQKKYIDAEDGYRWAMRSMDYRSSSFEQMAEINLIKKDFIKVLGQTDKSLAFNEENLNSYKIKAIAYRKLEKVEDAKRVLKKLLKIDPLNHFVLFEEYLLGAKPEQLVAFNNSFKSEMLKEEYLELAIFYSGLNLKNEAAEVLSNSPDYPISDYWLAWINRNDSSKKDQYLKKALSENPKGIFPYRIQTLEILEWASNEEPTWITDYYSALILWNKGRNEEALNLLVKWENTPDFVSFYYSRAQLKGASTDAGLKDLERALVFGDKQWRVYNELSKIYLSRKNITSALRISKDGHEKFKGNYILDITYAKILSLSGAFEKSAEILRNTKVLPYEGERSAHKIYEYNYLMLAYDNFKNGKYDLALELIQRSEKYPENLGSGAPYDPDYRNQHFLRSKIYDKMGKHKESDKAKNAIKKYDEKYNKRKFYNIFENSLNDSNMQPF